MNIEAEIRDLNRRVSELEGWLGFLMQQINAVHKDLLAFQAKTEQRFANNDDRLDRLERGVRSLREDMPAIVGSAVREVLGAARGRPRKKP
jgi:hypothetical protein